ncbi:hypothetical protein BS17DRAFT_244626 [Gyrodon lividus]|nr:hypothetical protein BS17DRAFT_244626 [Gyrodon lividus]
MRSAQEEEAEEESIFGSLELGCYFLFVASTITFPACDVSVHAAINNLRRRLEKIYTSLASSPPHQRKERHRVSRLLEPPQVTYLVVRCQCVPGDKVDKPSIAFLGLTGLRYQTVTRGSNISAALAPERYRSSMSRAETVACESKFGPRSRPRQDGDAPITFLYRCIFSLQGRMYADM